MFLFFLIGYRLKRGFGIILFCFGKIDLINFTNDTGMRTFLIAYQKHV